MKENIEKITNDFFKWLDINIDEIIVTEQEENIFLIKIETPDSGLLIWNHWKTFNDILHILRLIISNNSEEKMKIHLEINDYMKSKDERLQWFIESKIKYVESSGNDLKLPYYSAYDRKKIHGFVSDNNNDDIYTKSIWEGSSRRLYICKAEKKLTIDIDWDDI